MDYLQTEANPVRRFGGLGVVILLHLLLAYTLVTGLAKRAIDVIKQPIETKIIEEMNQPPPQDKPLPPPPKMEVPPPPFIPPPEVQIQQPQSADTITQTTSVTPTPQQFSNSAQMSDQGPVPAFADLNSCKPVYPRAALLAEEQGTVRVQFVVGTEGQLVSARVMKSSGYKNLDNAAVQGLSRCKFRAAFQNGQPIQSSFVSDYVWRLDG